MVFVKRFRDITTCADCIGGGTLEKEISGKMKGVRVQAKGRLYLLLLILTPNLVDQPLVFKPMLF